MKRHVSSLRLSTSRCSGCLNCVIITMFWYGLAIYNRKFSLYNNAMNKLKLLSVALVAIITLGAFVGCGQPSRNSETPIDSSKIESGGQENETMFNPDKDSPYKVADIVKPNLKWDTKTLFETVPEITEVKNVNVGKRLKLFKFKSVAYPRENKTFTQVYGCIGVPESEMPKGGYPAVVLVHGGNGQIFKEWIDYWNERGYVAIAYDTYSNGLGTVKGKVQKIKNPDGGPDENYTGSLKDDPADYENSWLYHGVVNAILCNNILRSRNDVNPSKIGMTGISWGSVITLVTSGVDKRFNAFAPVYGAGYLYDDSYWTAADKNATFGGEGKLDEWVAVYDPSSYLPYSTKPTFFVSGVADNCFSAQNRMKSAKLNKGKSFYSQRYDLQHGHSWNETEEIYLFFEHILGGKDTVPIIDGATVANGKVTLDYKKGEFKNVYLTYTTSDDEDSHKWLFFKEKIQAENGAYVADLPAGVTAWVIETEVDLNGKIARFSTPMYEVAK